MSPPETPSRVSVSCASGARQTIGRPRGSTSRERSYFGLDYPICWLVVRPAGETKGVPALPLLVFERHNPARLPGSRGERRRSWPEDGRGSGLLALRLGQDETRDIEREEEGFPRDLTASWGDPRRWQELMGSGRPKARQGMGLGPAGNTGRQGWRKGSGGTGAGPSVVRRDDLKELLVHVPKGGVVLLAVNHRAPVPSRPAGDERHFPPHVGS